MSIDETANRHGPGSPMKMLLSIEEAAMFLGAVIVFSRLDMHWWWFLVFILTPDLSMAGYLAGNKIGAACYNFVHHKAVALAVYGLGLYLHNENLQFAGIILFAHSSMDRMLGYGLKYEAGFGYTHLGRVGKK